MEPVTLPCSTCRHFYRMKRGCKAFPGGIPKVILSGQDSHEEPLPRQSNGIVYEQGPPDEFADTGEE